MLQNPCKTLGFKKNMVYKIPPGGGGKPYPASGLTAFGNCTFSTVHAMIIIQSVQKETQTRHTL